jgi:hypothetical protein
MQTLDSRLDQQAIRRSSAGSLITPEMDFRKETIDFIVADSAQPERDFSFFHCN